MKKKTAEKPIDKVLCLKLERQRDNGKENKFALGAGEVFLMMFYDATKKNSMAFQGRFRKFVA
jgi:hypothetical protein